MAAEFDNALRDGYGHEVRANSRYVHERLNYFKADYVVVTAHRFARALWPRRKYTYDVTSTNNANKFCVPDYQYPSNVFSEQGFHDFDQRSVLGYRDDVASHYIARVHPIRFSMVGIHIGGFLIIY